MINDFFFLLPLSMGTQATIMGGGGGHGGEEDKNPGVSSGFLCSHQFLASSNSWLKPQVPLEIAKPIPRTSWSMPKAAQRMFVLSVVLSALEL